MANVSGLLGTAGGFKGTGVAGPVSPTDPNQLATAYGGAQNTLQQQQGLLQALQGQNGLTNQNQVYGQLQGVANGTGPNPAQAMLNQSTGQNVANQAALMASSRGASQNAGLIARQAAMQGANTQQQAAGQAATMQAQQSLNAIGAAGQMATTQAGQQIGQTNANAQAQQSEQANLLGANQGMNQTNAGLISGTAQQQAAIGGGGMQGAGSVFSALADGGEVTKPAQQQTPQPLYGTDSASGPASMFGKFLKGSSSQPAQSGGDSIQQNPLYQGMASLGKGIGDYLKNQNTPTQTTDPFNAPNSPTVSQMPQAGTAGQHIADDNYAQGGMVKTILSPGEIKLSPKQVEQVRNGADPMKVGEKIKGGKLAVGGPVNSYSNDTVKKDVPEGSVIIPRSETKSATPSQNSKRFVDSVIAKRRSK